MPALVLPHLEERPAHEWLDSLRHNQQASQGGLISKITVADVVDRAADIKAHLLLEPTSPRSVEAFLRHGVEPEELRMHTLAEYKTLLGRADLAELAFRYQEAVRQDRIKAIVEERKRLDEPQGSSAKRNASKAANNEMGDMVEKEAKRLEVTRRRQERELQQLVHFETARKQQQDKAEERVKVQEARAEAQRKAKDAEQAEWHRLQHERELGRHKEEEQREREVKALENARFHKEQELLAQEAAEEKQRRRDGFRKEQERINKVEQARKETERILAEQQADVDRRKQDMMSRDEKREVAKGLRMEEARLKNEEAHAKAAQRIAAALAADKTIQQQKLAAYSDKQSQNTQRRAEKERLHDAARLETLKLEAAAEQQRWEAYEAAQQREEQRITSFLTKQQIKDIELEKLAVRREQKAAEQALQRQLDLDLKHSKVEAMKRRDLYRREMLLQRIQGDTQKTHEMLAARSGLQEQRKAANMSASFERQKLMQSFEKLQTTKKISNTMAGGGTVDVNALLRNMH